MKKLLCFKDTKWTKFLRATQFYCNKVQPFNLHWLPYTCNYTRVVSNWVALSNYPIWQVVQILHWIKVQQWREIINVNKSMTYVRTDVRVYEVQKDFNNGLLVLWADQLEGLFQLVSWRLTIWRVSNSKRSALSWMTTRTLRWLACILYMDLLMAVISHIKKSSKTFILPMKPLS